MNIENDRWKNRRRMAWLAMLAGLVYPFISIEPETAAALATPFYLFVGAVVGTYIGYSTADDKWQKEVE
ncbi:MAG TPA: hypothetical protein ENK35_04405 [Candidatus Tenderia sp.]|nr:hypothetical protein [Candidatus Tenderia sp.]